MGMRRALLLVFLVSVVSVSGCVEQTPGVITTEGIKINDFSFDRPTVYTKESVGLNLEIQNVGEIEGILKEVAVYGVDAISGPTPEPYAWAEGSYPSFTITDFSIIGDEKMFPSKPSLNLEGEMRSIRWKPRAPIDIKAPTDYDFRVRVKYDYETIYTGTIRVVKEGYLETLSETERKNLIEAGGVTSSSVTGGPLSVDVEGGGHFVVYDIDSQSRLIRFEITNVGSGFPYLGNESNSDSMYKVEIISVSPEGNFDCPVREPIKLSKGESTVFNCDFTPPTDFTNKIDMLFSMTFDYNYYVDGVASVTVKPEHI